jgi:uncharacterized protein
MKSNSNFVFDTNTLVSASLIKKSNPRLALNIARKSGTVLFSEDTLEELNEVLFRRKLDKYILRSNKYIFLASLVNNSVIIDVKTVIDICSNKKNNKFIDLAVDGNADYIITGASDLLELNSYQGIKILTPLEFIEEYKRSAGN